MQNFAQQCFELANMLWEPAAKTIAENGTIVPAEGEASLPNESAHAFAALAEYYRLTHKTNINDVSLLETSQHCLAQQLQQPTDTISFLQCALGLLAFNPAKERNPIWNSLDESTQKSFSQRLLTRDQGTSAFSKACNIIQSTARYSFGLSKKEDTPRLVDEFLDALKASNGWVLAPNEKESSDSPDILTTQCFLLIRQAFSLHTHFLMCERKLPGLRTAAEKILKLLPDMVRADGLAWAYGERAGIYGQLYAITLIVQGFYDQWIPSDKIPLYSDLLRRIFQFFFTTYIDIENACFVLQDEERSIPLSQSTCSLTFDTLRFLCQWTRLAQKSTLSLTDSVIPGKTKGRWVCFEKTYHQEQGLFLYQDATSGLLFQLPLLQPTKEKAQNTFSFPHCPGIFDASMEPLIPSLLPEITIQGTKTIPSYYGIRCSSGLGTKNSLYFSFEQPNLISDKGEILADLGGSCNVTWNFSGTHVTATFVYKFKQPVTIEKVRCVIPLSVPHSSRSLPFSPTLGENSLQTSIIKDDFGTSWKEIENVSDKANYKTCFGKICYLQVLERTNPLLVKPGKEYQLQLAYEIDVRKEK